MLKLLKCLRTSIINFLTEKIMFQGYEGTLLTFKVWWIAWPLLVAFSTWCLRCPFAELVLLFRDEHSTNDEQRRWRNKKTTANIKKTNAEKKEKHWKWYFSARNKHNLPMLAKVTAIPAISPLSRDATPPTK